MARFGVCHMSSGANYSDQIHLIPLQAGSLHLSSSTEAVVLLLNCASETRRRVGNPNASFCGDNATMRRTFASLFPLGFRIGCGP